MKSRQRKKWSDFTPAEKGVSILAGFAYMAYVGWTLRDIHRRPISQLRGPKPLWYAIATLHYLGPVTYFVVGRKRT